MIALVVLEVDLKNVKLAKYMIINVALHKKYDIHTLYALRLRNGPGWSGPKKQSLNPDQKPGRSGPGPRPGCQEVQEMPRLVLAS
jgi:hypothetical protein